MKGDGVCTVILRGQHRAHPLTATWSKQLGKVGGKIDGMWALTIQYRGRQRRFLMSRYEKPCWTVALKFVDQVVPPAGKAYVRHHGKQIAREQGLKIVR